MGLLSWLEGALPAVRSLDIEEKQLNGGFNAAVQGLGTGYGNGAVRLDQEGQNKLFRTNRLAQAITRPFVNKIINTKWAVAQPVDPVSSTAEVRAKVTEVKWREKSLLESDTFERVEDSRALRVWTSGNDEMTDIQVKTFIMANLILSGEVVLYMEMGSRSDASGRRTKEPIALWPFSVARVRTNKSSGEGTYDLVNASGEPKFSSVAKKDLLWIRMPGALDAYSEAASPGTSLAYAFSMDSEISQTLANRFAGNGVPQGIGTFKGASDEQVEEWTQVYNQRSAKDRAGTVLFTNREFDFKPLDSSIADLELSEQRDGNTKASRETAGIPPEVTGNTDNANRATAQVSEEIFFTNFSPYLEVICQALNKWFMPLFFGEAFYQMVAEGVAPKDREYRLAVYRAFPNDFTRNEKRALTKDDPVEGGDELPEVQLQAPAGELSQPRDADGDGQTNERGIDVPVIEIVRNA